MAGKVDKLRPNRRRRGLGLYLYAHDLPLMLVDTNGEAPVPLEKDVQKYYEAILTKYNWAFAPQPRCLVYGTRAVPDILALPPHLSWSYNPMVTPVHWFEIKREDPYLISSLSKLNANQPGYVPALKSGASAPRWQ